MTTKRPTARVTPVRSPCCSTSVAGSSRDVSVCQRAADVAAQRDTVLETAKAWLRTNRRRAEVRQRITGYQSMSRKIPQVDGYLRKNKQWQEELARLRQIVLDCGLTEEMKWRVPCYTFQQSNVVILGAFKACCTLSFLKGALLTDAKGILVKPG